ncbi:MAG: hypothetical protein J5637_08860 [Prevotella sp.]|nr:hypothetical protein [Prevotella sp.]
MKIYTFLLKAPRALKTLKSLKTLKPLKTLKTLRTFLFGQRCYAVIVGERGSDRYDIASQIHFSKASARAHRCRIEQTRTYVYITTVTFRWRTRR